jgi:hypothetical protein
MLRNALLIEINQMISSITYFSENDFLITNSINKDGMYVLEIEYRFDSNYKFTAWIPKQKSKESYADYKVGTTESPGEISNTEFLAYTGKRDLFNGIQAWLTRVRDDLLAIPKQRQTSDQKAQLDEILTELPELDDEYFSPEEILRLKQKLDELEGRLAENIMMTVTDQKEQKEKLKSLEEDIIMLKGKLGSHKKRGWAGTVSLRLIRWAEDPINQRVLTSGAQATKELLLEAPPSENRSSKSANKIS